MAFLTDGYQSVIHFNIFTVNGIADGAFFREKTVKPPDLDGNGMLDTTTMRNVTFRSYQPKKLLGMSGAMTCAVQYDPGIYNALVGIVFLNKVDFIHIRFPDDSQIKFFGWIGKFDPKALKEGEFAEADIEVYVSHQDKFGVNQPIQYFLPGTGLPAATFGMTSFAA